MQGHRRRRATQRSPATPISPKGGGGTASISLSLLLHDVTNIASSSLRELGAVALATNSTISQHHIYETRTNGGLSRDVAQRTSAGASAASRRQPVSHPGYDGKTVATRVKNVPRMRFGSATGSPLVS